MCTVSFPLFNSVRPFSVRIKIIKTEFITLNKQQLLYCCMFIWSFKFSLIWFCLCYGACRLSMPHTIAFSLRQNKLDLIRIYYKFGGCIFLQFPVWWRGETKSEECARGWFSGLNRRFAELAETTKPCDNSKMGQIGTRYCVEAQLFPIFTTHDEKLMARAGNQNQVTEYSGNGIYTREEGKIKPACKHTLTT